MKQIFAAVMTIGLTAASALGQDAPASRGPFRVRGFHFTLAPGQEAFYREQFEKVGKMGYDTLVLMLSSGRGLCYRSAVAPPPYDDAYTREQLAGLIAHARSLGLTVVPEIKLWGKQEKTLGSTFIQAHPDMFACPKSGNGALYDPNYRFPDGRSIHEAAIFPLMDEVIALFGQTPPPYFHIGFDEYRTDCMAQLAERHGATAPELFAQELNRLTDYLLSRGITPMIYQDMLIGPALAEEGHGVEGFKPDPRFGKYNTMHAQFPPNSKTSVLTAMNHIRNRDKTIVVDWHYGGGTPEGEFPSVDYFRKMGFKDVWGQTWFNEDGIRTFAKYMADHNGTGMIASTYHTPRQPDVLHLYPRILHNSIIYFRDPNFMPPSPPSLCVTSGASAAPTVFVGPEGRLTVEVRLPESVTQIAEPALFLRRCLAQGATVWERVGGEGTYDPGRRTLSFALDAAAATAAIGASANDNDGIHIFDGRADVVDRKTGYLLQAIEECLFAVTGKTPDVSWPAAADPAVLCDLTFEPPRFLDEKETMIAIPGARPMIGFLHKARLVEHEGAHVLRCGGGGGLILLPSKTVLRRFAEAGVGFEMEFMLTQPPPNDVHYLFSCGSYHSGMRLYVSKGQAIQGQVAQRGVGPVRLTASEKAQVGVWHKLQFTLSPERDHAVITLDGKRVAEAPVQCPAPTPENVPFGVGAEVRSSGAQGVKTWCGFLGLIRSFRMRVVPRPAAP
ncbi:MAG: family 20 glycosylhydrolase [Planctomycetota bacterium]